jgi:hypothetical protein
MVRPPCSIPGSEGPMSDTDRQPECRSYGAGHNVHYIQANRARRHPENRRSGTVTSVAGQTVELNLDDGEVVRLWTHDAVRVERLVAEGGARADYHRDWSLLDFHRADVVAHVSVSTKADIGPCVQQEEGGVMMRPDDGEAQAAFAQRFHQHIERSQDG